MVKENKELMSEALDALKGRWGLAIGTYVVLAVVCSAVQLVPCVGKILPLLIGGPLAVGAACFSLQLARKEELPEWSDIFEGFDSTYLKDAIITYLLMSVFVVLWSLLFVIPGIIAAISYSQVFYILYDDDEYYEPREALKKSKEMMEGYKMKYFCLMLRFFGWAVLCVVTL